MVAAVQEKSAVDASGSGQEPAILTWFKWAEKLTTGLGSKTKWTASEENNFDAVLHSLVAALHHRPGDRISDEIRGAMDINPVKAPVKLVMQPSHHVTLETMARFLLERLETRMNTGGQEQAFDLAEKLRAATSPRSVFAAQLQLFQMNMVEGNPELATRDHAEWGDRSELTKLASTPRTINPTTFTADVYRSADSLMRNFFKREGARLDAA